MRAISAGSGPARAVVALAVEAIVAIAVDTDAWQGYNDIGRYRFRGT
jgi:hypothetical protein